MGPRTILYTGKGGVGKTSVAAATARRIAAGGRRVIVLSTDPAHSLADVLECPVGGEPTDVGDGLFAQQVQAQEALERNWSQVSGWLGGMLATRGIDPIAAEELSVPPGGDELFSLLALKGHSESGDWDTIVVDCAPTAETIRLLSLPDVLEWYMERVFPLGRRLTRVVAPVLNRVSPLPVADDDVFGAAHRLYRRLEGVKEVLTDTRRSSIRLVVNPERMVVAEARRTHTYLALFGYPVDAVVANRVLSAPDPADGPAGAWLDRWTGIHAENLAAIHEGFAPVPVLRSAWAADEPVGLDGLRSLAAGLYEGRDPAAVLHAGEPFAITRDGPGYVLRIELPFAAREDVELSHQPGEVLLRVGPYRRAIVLPDSLRRRPVTGARLSDGVLRITFDEPARAGRRGPPAETGGPAPVVGPEPAVAGRRG
jgi:arsenite-transporting ATPase